jgi:hypothetical protein
MTHILILAEGYSDALRAFEKEMHGRKYAGGKAKLRVREAKLYTCSINECGRDEFISDMLGLQNMFPNHNKHPFKWGILLNTARWLANVLGVKKLPNGIKPNSVFGKSRSEGGVTYNAHFLLIGEVPDYKDKNGIEQV